jgi:tetratricopeptide (TPR) repeat protein
MIRTVAPWLVAPVDELSIGADVIAIDDRTVAIVPLSQSKIEPQALASGVEAMAGATNEKQVGSQRSDVDSAKDVESNDDDSSAPKPEASAYGSGGVQVRLVFAKDGRLTERRVVRVQDDETKTLVRVRFNRKGQITVFDGEGQQIAKTLRRRTPGTQPFGGLQIERKDLVILPLPYRDASTIFADVGPHAEQHHGHDGDYSNWPEENALALLATDAINQNRQRLAQVVMSRFFTKGDTRAGLYVLIANANPMRTVSPAKDGNPTVQKLILNYQPNDKVSDQHKALIRFARHLATASTDNEFNPSELLPQIEPQALASGVGARTGATNEKQVGSQKSDVDSATDVDSDDVNSLALRPEASAYGSNGEAGTDGLGGVGRFLYNICRARNTYYRWYQKRALRSLRKDGLAKEVDSAIDVVGSLRSPALGWTILRTMQPYLDHPEFYAKFADAAKKYENAPHIAWFVRHERARALFKANKPEEASKLYGELLTKTLKAGFNPGIDKELRQQFIKHRGQRNWSDMCRQTAGKLIDDELLRTAITLSKQLRDLGDIDTANSIFEKTIAKLEPKERPDVAMIAIQRLRELKQDDEADKLLSGMLENPWVATSAKLWRYGSSLAEARGKTAEALRRLERAVTIEFVTRPDVINLQEIRTKYTALLQKYEQIADASATLEQEPPNDLVARIVRTADQWRSMEDDETLVCQLAHRILNKLGQHDLAWDFATTPLGTQPGSSSWRSLGQHLGRQKEIDRAANAYVKAFQFEQTNPEILWEHATLLRINGRESDSMPLIKRIAEGKWQPRFNAVKQTAATLLEM